MGSDAFTTEEVAADFVIVGFGPVGKLIAILLGGAGHTVAVVDRKVSGYPLPRAVTHDFEFARILQSIGLAPDRIRDVTEPYDSMYVWRNADRQTLVEVDWSGIGSSGWYNTYFFNQPALEDRMEALVAAIPNITVMRGWDATVRETSASGVVVDIEHFETGARRSIRSEYLIGADGAKSTVRESVGIDWHDFGFYYDWLVVDVVPEPSLAFPHVAIQTCDIARPATMVPGGPGRRRWEFMRLPGETIESLNRAERAWDLLEPFGITPENSVLERHSVYTFQAGYATAWRQGRVLLAGDAAHLMPPFAGQGLGAGFRDAVNLAWKLDAVMRGRAAEALLDTYFTERLPHIKEFIDFSIALGRIICITDPIEAAERDARMIAQVGDGKLDAPPAPRLGPPQHHSGGGFLSPQGIVRYAQEEGRFDDLFPGTVLVIADAALYDGLSERSRRAVVDLSITVVALSGTAAGVHSVEDLNGTYIAWLASIEADAVLIRPDFYTFGSSRGPLDQLIGAFANALGDPKRSLFTP